jgi:DNA-binding protein HU-beta
LSTYSNKAVALFEYLPEDTVLTGLPAVTVGLSPDALSERAGIKWTGDDTELGPSVFSVFRLHPGGPRFFLSSWENAPYPAVTVSSDARAKESDIDMLLARLGVAEDEIIDRVPVRAAQPAARRARLLSKADIIEAVANNSGLSKADSARAVESLVNTVTRTLKKGDEVSITGFGKFSVVQRAARQGVNPRTGEKIRIKASKAPKFTAGAQLKQSVSRKAS